MLRIYFLQHWFNLTDLACKKRCMTVPAYDTSLASTWGAKQCLLQFATCWNNISSESNCSPKWGGCCRKAV